METLSVYICNADQPVLCKFNKFNTSEIPEFNTGCEIVWCRVSIKGQKDLCIGSFYRPPDGKLEPLEQLESSLSRVNSSNSNIILAGEFNLPFVDSESDVILPGARHVKLHEKLLSVFNDARPCQSNLKPTRKNNILDLLLTNTPKAVNIIETIPGLSDHDAIFAEIDTHPHINEIPGRKILIYAKMDTDGFKRHLDSWTQQFIRYKANKGVLNLWDDFKEMLNSGAEKFIPSKILEKQHRLPWVSNNIKRLIRQRDKAFSTMKDSSTQENIDKFKDLKSTVREIRKKYNKYIEDLIEPNFDKGNKKLWGMVKRIKRDSSGVGPLKENGNLISDPLGKANLLNKQFQSVFHPPNDPSSLPTMGPSPFNPMPYLSKITGLLNSSQ